MLQAQQLNAELEKAREQIALKNQTTLGLREDNLKLEEKLRETTSQLKQVRGSLDVESQTRKKLDQRNMKLKLIIFQLRHKHGDDDVSLYTQERSEVSLKMAELSHSLKEQLDQQRDQNDEVRNKDIRRLEELRAKVGGNFQILLQKLSSLSIHNKIETP